MGVLAVLTAINVGGSIVKAAMGLFTGEEKKKVAEKLVQALPDKTKVVTDRIINNVLQLSGTNPPDHCGSEGKIVNYMKSDKDLYVSFLEALLLKQKSLQVVQDNGVAPSPSDYLKPIVQLTKTAGEKLVKDGNEKHLVKAVKDVMDSIVDGKKHLAGGLAREHGKDLAKEVLNHFCTNEQPMGSLQSDRVNAVPGFSAEAVLESVPGVHKTEEEIEKLAEEVVKKD